MDSYYLIQILDVQFVDKPLHTLRVSIFGLLKLAFSGGLDGHKFEQSNRSLIKNKLGNIQPQFFYIASWFNLCHLVLLILNVTHV